MLDRTGLGLNNRRSSYNVKWDRWTYGVVGKNILPSCCCCKWSLWDASRAEMEMTEGVDALCGMHNCTDMCNCTDVYV